MCGQCPWWFHRFWNLWIQKTKHKVKGFSIPVICTTDDRNGHTKTITDTSDDDSNCIFGNSVKLTPGPFKSCFEALVFFTFFPLTLWLLF